MNWNNIPLRVRRGPWPDHPAGPSGSGHKIPEKNVNEAWTKNHDSMPF
jgi:hypothetical protein